MKPTLTWAVLVVSIFVLLGLSFSGAGTDWSAWLDTDSDAHRSIRAAKTYDALVEQLDNPNSETVSYALWRLSRIQDARVPDLFIELWETGRASSLNNARETLKSADVRLVVASTLIDFGYIDSPSCKKFILESAKSSKASIRTQAASALATVGDPDGIKTLSQLAHDDDTRVVMAALSSLEAIALQYGNQTEGVKSFL